MRKIGLIAAMTLIALPATAATPQAEGPTEAQVKACLQQLDVGGKWKFEWREIIVGQRRAPLNSYESMTLIGRASDPNFTGYPVRAKFRFADTTDIDGYYWFYRENDGSWQVPFTCSVK
jgi:hypothetical protein